jgi:hypothetical protein
MSANARWAHAAAAALAASALGTTACGDAALPAAPPAAIAPAADALTKVTETGPVKASVRVWPAKPALGDPLYARLTVEAPAGFTIDAPFQEAGDQRLGRFRVVAFDRDTRHGASGGQLHEQTYTLEAFASGRHRIPPLRVEVVDGRAGAGPGSAAPRPQELLTDEVPVDIAPVKAEAVDAELAPLRGELAVRVGGTSPLAIAGIASALLVLASGAILAWRALAARRRIRQQRSAYDEAVAALRALEDRGAPPPDAADGWFVELSAIVRRYLEHRYEIRAPELTTEEFLLVATARPELRADHRGLLSSFLERCDRVKFAGYRPDATESLATLAAARGFIEDTRLRLAEVAP